MASYDVTTANATLEFETQAASRFDGAMIDATHALIIWNGFGGDGFAQVLNVDAGTYAITTANSSLEFDTQNFDDPKMLMVDANHAIVLWRGQVDDNDCLAQILTINTSTWAVTTAAAPTTVNGSIGFSGPIVKIDTNHFQAFWRDAATGDGFTQILEVNTTTWAITALGSSVEFDTVDYNYGTAVRMDANHVLGFWAGSAGDGYTQIFEINTTTWAISLSGSPLEFDTTNASYNSCIKLDDTHALNIWQGPLGDGFMQVFAVNTTTWAVTTAAASLEFDTQDYQTGQVLSVDTGHAIVFWAGPSTDGFAETFVINTSTWVCSTSNASLEFDTQNGNNVQAFQISTGHFIAMWGNVSNHGIAQPFTVEIPSSGVFTKNILALQAVNRASTY